MKRIKLPFIVKWLLFWASIAASMIFGYIRYKVDHPIHNLYVRPVVITDKQWNTQTYIGIDTNGNEWEFSNTNDWTIGETIYLIMNTNGTDYITDDIILMENRAE